jgi:aspartate/methionine/tyrosine aminotransferase
MKPDPLDKADNSSYLRAVLDDIKHNPGAEIARYARRNPDVLALSMGEADYPTPDFIIQAVNEALKEGKTFYGPILGRSELRSELGVYHKAVYDVSLPMERIVITGSGTSAIHLALTSILDKGDEVVTLFPLWKNLLGAIRLQQAFVKGVNLELEEGKWVLDLQALFDSVTEKTKAIIINSPNNPLGWIMSKEDMREIIHFARERGLWIISDEVYNRLVFDSSRAPSFLDVSEPDDKLFIVNSFSKNWAMTGWRLGWLIIPEDIEQKIYDLVLYDNMGPPNFTQFGAISALRHGESFIQEQIERYQANMSYVWDSFDTIGKIKAIKPESGFYAFFKVDGQADCMELSRYLIDNVGLGLTPGCAFGRDYQGYLRLCFAVSQDKLSQALDKLDEGLKAIS